MVELFQAITHPAIKTVQGLWAELFLIAKSQKPLIIAEAWHKSPDALYDFSLGFQKVEVKSASGYIREHHFSLSQLQPPTNTEAIIASLFVHRSDSGVSVEELIDEIHGRLQSRVELSLHVSDVVIRTLGSHYLTALDDRFDVELAQASLGFFDARSVPTINAEIPGEVSDIRFKSDLSKTPPMQPSELRSKGGLFAGLPRLIGRDRNPVRP